MRAIGSLLLVKEVCPQCPVTLCSVILRLWPLARFLCPSEVSDSVGEEGGVSQLGCRIQGGFIKGEGWGWGGSGKASELYDVIINSA